MKKRDDNNLPSETELMKSELEKRIAGEIVLSENPGNVIKKWRNLFKISQKELSKNANITPSVISDYESCRRKSPGIGIIKKIINSLIGIEFSRGGNIIKEFSPYSGSLINAILDIKEFTEPVSIKRFCNVAKCSFVNKCNINNKIFGYTVIDSLTAIINFPPSELVKIYGSTTERALIFTKVSTGRSPMVAIRVTELKPRLVVLHGIRDVDDIALQIAKVENIPLAISEKRDIKDIIKDLRKNFT